MTGLTRGQALAKRSIDVAGATAGLLLSGWLIALGWLVARASTGCSGLFRQERVGRGGRIFMIYKLRTMVCDASRSGSITVGDDERVTRAGRVLRRFRIDELPQLWNVLRGDMSLVGPRPDVPGFADGLEGDDRIILTVRPGMTGPATLAFRDEGAVLASVSDAEEFNRRVIFPAKVRINREYVRDYSVVRDLRYIFMTLVGARMDPTPFMADSERPR